MLKTHQIPNWNRYQNPLRDTRSTYFNPKYIQAIKSYGATGAGIFADFFRYMSAWKITSPDSVNDNMFQEAYEVTSRINMVWE